MPARLPHFCGCVPASLIFLYLFKYLFKGPDHARFTVHSLEQGADGEQPRDEYQEYVDGRYLSSTEAVYRFFGYNSVWKSPGVVCLPGRPEPYSNAANRNCRS